MNTITNNIVLQIRTENKRIIDSLSFATNSDRYESIAKKFTISEWSARWICQGREYLDAGGFIEPYNHEGHTTRAIEDDEALRVREDFVKNHSVYSLANRHAVSTTTIARILLGKTYRNVGGPTFTRDQIRSNFGVRPVGYKTLTAKDRLTKKILPRDPAKPLILVTTSVDAKQDERPTTHEENRLSSIDVYLIRSSYKSGSSLESLADKYGLYKESVLDIISGKIFADKPGPIQKIKELV